MRAPARPRGRAHGGGGDLWQEVAQDGGHLLDVGRVLRGLRAGRHSLRDERVDPLSPFCYGRNFMTMASKLYH